MLIDYSVEGGYVMEQLMDKIKMIAFNYPNIYKIILFGSRARGDFRSSSDIDLALFSKYESSLEVSNFTNDIEKLDTLLKFDIVFIKGFVVICRPLQSIAV